MIAPGVTTAAGGPACEMRPGMKTVSMKIALLSAVALLASASAVSAQQTGSVPIPPPPRASAPVLPPVGQPVIQPDETAVSLPPLLAPPPPPVTAPAPAGASAAPAVTVIPGAQTSGGAVIAPARPRASGSTQVTLQIELETEQDGPISVSIHQDGETFRRGQTPLRTLMVARNGPVTRAWILGLAPGRYAISAWQDVDGDGVQRKGALGLGGEPSGWSNNVRSRFGSPTFDQAAFDLPATGATQGIRLR